MVFDSENFRFEEEIIKFIVQFFQISFSKEHFNYNGNPFFDYHVIYLHCRIHLEIVNYRMLLSCLTDRYITEIVHINVKQFCIVCTSMFAPPTNMDGSSDLFSTFQTLVVRHTIVRRAVNCNHGLKARPVKLYYSSS